MNRILNPGLFIAATVVFCCFLSSCGSMKVYVNNDSTYSRQNPITINQERDDGSGTLGELQYLLQSNGYKLMSYSAAKKALNFDTETGYNTVHSEITSTTQFHSVYILDFDYMYYFDSFYCVYNKFSATITDLTTGEIIMTAHFRGNRYCHKVLKQLVAKMNQTIK